MQSIAADIPAQLAWADDLLTRYGLWAIGSGRGTRTCGSAEGDYRPPAGEGDERRVPGPLRLTSAEAVAVSRALYAVPERERTVLAVLYVPRRQSAASQLRMLRIPPQLSRIRHEAGLRMFANVCTESQTTKHAHE